MIRNLVKKHAIHFAYFYRHLRYRFFVMLIMTVFIGILDGFGLAMFLPLLELVAEPTAGANAGSLGKLAFLVKGLQGAGLPLNLTVVLLVILVFFSLKGAANFLAQWIMVVYRQYFMRRIREQNINALARYGYERFVRADAGRIQNSLSGEVERVDRAYRSYVFVAQNGIQILVYTTLAFLVNPQFAVLVALGALLVNFAFRALYVATKRHSRELTAQGHNFHGLLIQQVAFFKYLKASGRLWPYTRKLVQKVYEIERTQRAIGTLTAVMHGVREPLLIAVVVAVILVEVNLLGGKLTLILLSILFFYRALAFVMQFQTNWSQFLAVSGSVENQIRFSRELEEGRERTGQRVFARFENALELDRVSFAFDQVPVLSDVTLRIKRNETVALVGESGSGKTTLMNVLGGLLAPTRGTVRVDGVSLQDLDVATFQARIGYIAQDPVIFNDTVFNNVAFWVDKTPESLNRFRAALERAHLRDFVDGLPEREETLLGNNGINLSGGQKQRISIARELFRDVDFLFLDEATSALDSETELSIRESIGRLKGRYTMVIIAHRLSTIRDADRVVVLAKGAIDAVGTYREIAQNSATFRRMVELQELRCGSGDAAESGATGSPNPGQQA